MLTTHRLLPLNGSAPQQAVIFLHGLGDRGDGGLLEICSLWQRALPACEFLCPDAPFAFDYFRSSPSDAPRPERSGESAATPSRAPEGELRESNEMPPDFGGRQWFSLREFTPVSVAAGVREATPHVNAYIDHVLETRHLKPAQLVLAGFSQGTMMALHVGLRRNEPVAGILGYSGALADAGNLAAEKRCASPVMLIHGLQDDVVPFAAMGEAERYLKASGVPVTTVACDRLGHSIDEKGVMEGSRFLQKQFEKTL